MFIRKQKKKRKEVNTYKNIQPNIYKIRNKTNRTTQL